MKHPRWARGLYHSLPKIELTVDSRLGPVVILKFKKGKRGFALCHRRKERSLHMWGHTFPICARCTGLWTGFGIGLSFHILGLSMPSVFSVAFTLPLIMDGFTQFFGFRESNNPLRLLTGILFGIAVNMLFL